MAEGMLQINVASIVEDVLQQHGKRLSDIDLASRKAEEASLRRNEAAGWLRKMVGVVGGKDLPAQPSDEEFRLGLRSGIVLCNVLNRVQTGSVPKVVEAPADIVPDGAALSAYQYFENVRNFLDAIGELGVPTFEASDLEQGGKTSRIVNSVLALKSYHEWQEGGKHGVWKFSGISRPAPAAVKQFLRKNSELFMNSISRSVSAEKPRDCVLNDNNLCADQDLSEMDLSSDSVYGLVRQLLCDKKQEDIPVIVENMLSKVMEEFELRLAAAQNEQITTDTRDNTISVPQKSLSRHASMEIEKPPVIIKKDSSLSLKRTAKESVNETLNENKTLNENVSKTINETVNEVVKDTCDGKSKDQHLTEQQLQAECPRLVEQQPETEQQRVAEQQLQAEHQRLAAQQRLLEHQRSIDQQRLTEYQRLTEQQNLAKQQRLAEHQRLVEHQQRGIEELKSTLHSAKEDMQIMQMKYQEEVNNLGKYIHGLAHAASGYQKALEENRKLYNQVQDLKGNIRVYCRVRPFLHGDKSRPSTVGDIDDRNLTIISQLRNGKEAKKAFTFNRAFGPTSSQEEVYVDMQPLVRSVLDGYNVCIFAYGQTGSGKTFTMTGPEVLTKESLGVNFRALSDLFDITEQRKDTISYDVSVQMMEIYNEQVRDLLVTDGQNKKLEIRNNSQNGFNVPNANTVSVSSTSDVINMMDIGHKNRAVGSTSMNDRSSRSHSCLTVHVQGKDLASGTVLHGCMHLVDLAGSERVDKTDATGDRLKEAQHINRSLSALGDVISSLAAKQSHVPYRNSKLTQLLQDSLGGQAKTLMFVHISPEPDALGETMSTLKFAERVSMVELGAAKANKDSSNVKELKEQIASLKAALARKDGGEMQQQGTYTSPERTRFLSSGSSPLGSSWSSAGDLSKLEGGRSSSLSRRQSLDSQDLLLDSSSVIDDEKGDWVDKVVVNISAERRHSLDNGLAHTKFESPIIDDSDELELESATSDSSELDYKYQQNVTRCNSMPNAQASKLKKPSPVQKKTPETRSQIPAAPTKKVAKGGQSPLNKQVRRPVSSDVKRKPTSGK